MDNLVRAIKSNTETTVDRQAIIRDLIRNLKAMNPNAKVDWLYSEKRYLETKSDSELQGMLLINC